MFRIIVFISQTSMLVAQILDLGAEFIETVNLQGHLS